MGGKLSWWKRVTVPQPEPLRGGASKDHLPEFTEIVHTHQAMVFSLAKHYLHDRGLAEELTQEVFLLLYQNLTTIQSRAHLTFWLRKVTSHRCIDYVRRRKLWPQVSLDDVAEPIAEVPATDVLFERKLQRCMAALPEKPRMIVILRYLEDLEPAEIAKLMGMPVNTVKSHLQRSLAILREKLDGVLEKQMYERSRR